MIASCPMIHDNQIQKNKSSGIVLQKYSEPKITNNRIIGNGGIGVYVKDRSTL